MTNRRPARSQPVLAVAVDMRLTGAEVERLDPEQTRALFEGAGGLAAILSSTGSKGRR